MEGSESVTKYIACFFIVFPAVLMAMAVLGSEDRKAGAVRGLAFMSTLLVLTVGVLLWNASSLATAAELGTVEALKVAIGRQLPPYVVLALLLAAVIPGLAIAIPPEKKKQRAESASNQKADQDHAG